MLRLRTFHFFFFNDTATTEIYTLSLHDALPILTAVGAEMVGGAEGLGNRLAYYSSLIRMPQFFAVILILALIRSEEHTSELQSRQYLVCRLLLEKKKTYSYST